MRNTRTINHTRYVGCWFQFKISKIPKFNATFSSSYNCSYNNNTFVWLLSVGESSLWRESECKQISIEILCVYCIALLLDDLYLVEFSSSLWFNRN